ncbi:LPXTG cell wall anchor domain-containing protein [Streptococcus vestibularis]|uniref:LPXTG cell wall anchor domain-containing protein n=1 Tax=Streptococcus vestibularis TaxID=1343 RepID=UPI003A7F3E6B
MKLRTISPTAQELAERKLANSKEFKASIEEQLATAKANLTTKTTEVETARTAALEAEKAVETARTALKTAAESNLAKANAYVLSQKGRYKVTARAVDSNGVVTTPTVDGTDAGEVTEDAVAETTYYIVVTEPEKSSGAQAQKQTDSMADNFNDGKEGTTVSNYKLVDPKTGAKVESLTTEEGTYTVDPTTGEVSFTPAEGFVGTAAPITVAADVTFNDESGNPVTVPVSNTYTPTVYGIDPADDETTGKQGQTQTSISGKERFEELNTATNTPDGTNVDWTTAAYSLEGANAEGKVVVDGEGTYSIDPTTGVVTFEPLPTFTGKAKGVNVQVSVTATDSEGNKVPVTSKGSYTPEVTPVKPTGEGVTSSGKQGQEQTGTPKFTQGDETAPITINEQQPAKFVVNGQPVEDKEIPATKDGKEVGKYVIDPLTGVVTFKPNKDFVGTPDPATVEVKDKNGTPATATYTPTVTPVTPTAEPKETTGKQGQPQTQDTESMFKQGDEVAPIDKTTVKLVDPSGNEVTTMPALKDGKEVGTYTIDPTTGVITFQPNKDFVGTPDPAKVVAKDTNGTKVETTYTPTVTPVTPTAEPAETTDIQGKTQNGTPTFTPGNPEVPMDDEVPATFEDGSTTKTIPGEGTYTVAKDGTVIFTPEKTFTGVGTGVTVKRVDKNGTPVTAKYTPTVTPVKPEGTPAVSEGPKGQPQTGTPTFTPGNPNVPIDEDVPPTFEDGTTTKIVPGEGTYTIDENGKVTFTPEPDFVGKASGVTVKRVDKNGTPVTATYTPTVRPDTSFVDKDGNPLSLTEDGTKPTKDIPGYKIVKTEVDEKGNTKHIYEKVTTTHKDKDGNVIPGTTTEEGTTPKKDIPGYRFVETKTLPNGDTEHVYEKVTTSFKDKEGNVIPNYPTEDGEQPNKDIPGYRFVETKTLPNGDIEHVYEKVSTPAPTPSPVPQPTPGKQNTTTWTDENGNPLKPTEPGSKEPGTVSGYEYVKTVTDPNGNIKHIFKKVEMPTSRPVEPSQPATPKYVEGQKELPNTGTEDNNSLAALGLLGVLSGFGLVARKKKED